MKTPWHYLTWTPPELEPQAEKNLAALTRKRGWGWAIRLHWGIVDGEASRIGKLRVFLAKNYAGVVLVLGALLVKGLALGDGWISSLMLLGVGWLTTVVWGTAKFVGWLMAIMARWPPVGRA